MNSIIHGDCLEVLKTLANNSVDLLCTDPPYGYSFMGKDWDKAVPSVEVWKEALRVLKPGGFAFIMSAPRSDVLSRMIMRIEDAGFRVDFTPIYWTYASGFPKAMNIGKMVDKRNGRQPEQVKALGEYLRSSRGNRPQKEISKFFPSKTGGLTGCVANWELGLNVPTKAQYEILKRELSLDDRFDELIEREEAEREVLAREKMTFGVGGASKRMGAEKLTTKPALDAAKTLDGSYGGFQPKPAVEVIIVAMKPLSEKTYVDQALKNGKGITWLDDCRVPSGGHVVKGGGGGDGTGWGKKEEINKEVSGRFPANLLISNQILDTIPCTCDTNADITQIADKDLNLEEDGTKESTTRENLTHQNVVEKSLKPSREKRSRRRTGSLSQGLESLSTTNEAESQSEATTATALMGDGCEPSGNVMETSASSVEQPKTSISTTSSRSRSTQNLDTKSPMGAYCALHATGKRRPTESNQQYSRFFSLDAWAKTLPFLIVPKASKGEKNEGLDHLEAKAHSGEHFSSPRLNDPRMKGEQRRLPNQNNHPTVKPLKLMSYLITLGSRQGDTVLEPFAGSGTTCVAAKMLGRNFIGIEKEKEYVDIANARLNAVPTSLFATL